MIQYIVTSPIYEHLRYPPTLMAERAEDARKMGKVLKLVIGPYDLIDPDKPPILGNFKFPEEQFHAVDVVVFVEADHETSYRIKGESD